MTAYDLTPAFLLAITILAGIVIRYAIPILKERCGQERVKRLWQYAQIAIQAAEQLYGAGAGKEKAEYVRKFLTEQGFTLSTGEIQAALEAAVYQLNAAITEESAVDVQIRELPHGGAD